MNKEIKAKWVDALLSAKYREEAGCLRTSINGFCVIGVLVDIAIVDGGVGHWVRHRSGVWYHEIDNADGVSEWHLAAAPEVMEWAEIALGREMYEFTNLWQLMDEQHMSFRELASYIEKTF